MTNKILLVFFISLMSCLPFWLSPAFAGTVCSGDLLDITIQSGIDEQLQCEVACCNQGANYKDAGYKASKGWDGYCAAGETPTNHPTSQYCGKEASCCCTNRWVSGPKNVCKQLPSPPHTPTQGTLRPAGSYGGTLYSIIKQKVDRSVNFADLNYGVPSNFFGRDSLPRYIGEVIKILLGLLGIIFLSMVVYAGFKWLTAAGDEKKVGDAINIINHALFGLAIVVGAYVITHWVVSMITGAAAP